MGDLFGATLSIGFPVFILLFGLLIYFAVTISDPQAKKQALFKTGIGIVAAFMAFGAIANYQVNFYGNSRLLPVSLVLITVTNTNGTSSTWCSCWLSGSWSSSRRIRS